MNALQPERDEGELPGQREKPVFLVFQELLSATNDPGFESEDSLFKCPYPGYDEFRDSGRCLHPCVRDDIDDRIIFFVAYAADDREGKGRKGRVCAERRHDDRINTAQRDCRERRAV